MNWVTEDQIERAKRVDVLAYILRTEPENIRRVGREYRLKDHASLAVGTGKWYWHSRGIGGRTAVGYLTDVRGYAFADAVCAVLEESPADRAVPANIAPPLAREAFALPLRHRDNRRVIAYLQSRGIDKGVILDCISRGDLYETKGFHNCCFVGRDACGRARYAALRGTVGRFKCDVTGSDKQYGFVIPPRHTDSRAVAVFEAAIDALSHQTLCEQGLIPPFDGWRLSLGGTSLLALEHFLRQHPAVAHCLVCTDDDDAGDVAAVNIRRLAGITTARAPPVCGKDWNEALMALQQAERAGVHGKPTERSRRPLQEQVNEKAVALSSRGARMTGRLLAQLMRAYLRHRQREKSIHGVKQPKQGRQSLHSLKKQGASLADIEIAGDNIGSFTRIARRYNLDFALKRDDAANPPRWIVFFKAKDDKALDAAFKEYSKAVLSPQVKKPSLKKRIAQIKQRLQAMTAPVRSKNRGEHEL